MEDPMGENKDDNFGPMVEIERKKNKIKLTRTKRDSVFESQSKGKCEQMRKEKSGVCMQPHVRDGMVYFGKLT